jgi:hypothetical protein
MSLLHNINLESVLTQVVESMEDAEEYDFGELSGFNKKEHTLRLMKEKLGELYPSYEHEIELLIETIVFVSKVGSKLKINKKFNGCFKNCLK